ncbi:MAG: two-component system, OmpR family, sensor kinase [Marmoricola sp.]|nr:two-component system, OmpR family, sensor kinase [Marmoricola sp.]
MQQDVVPTQGRIFGRPRTLSTNLLLVMVLLAITAAAISGIATTLLLRHYQGSRLNQDVLASVQRAVHNPGIGTGPVPDGFGDGPGAARALGSQTLTAYLVPPTVGTNVAYVTSARGEVKSLSSADLAAIRVQVVNHPGITTITLPGVGTYRLATAKIGLTDGSTIDVVAGLPTAQLDEMTRKLVLWAIAIAIAVAVLSAVAGRFIIARQLRGLKTVAAVAHDVSELPLASGQIEGITGVPEALADGITEVGQVGFAFNKMLNHMEDALQVRTASEQRARQFIADASHEIRTPLAVIRGFADLAERVPEGEEEALRGSIGRIQGSARELSTLVEDMMSLTRLDSGGTPSLGEVDLSEIAANAQEAAALLYPDHGWAVELPPTPVVVVGDELGLRRVITNLLANAGTHTPAGSTVVLAIEPVGNRVRIAVTDDGPGIPTELLERIFDRFVRADQARTSGNGSGLGLAIVKAIVDNHHGTIAVHSDAAGTSIVADIPVAGA